MGGLIGRAFGGAFTGAWAGSAFGIPGAILGAIAGAIVGDEFGKWLLGALGDLGLHGSALVDSLADLLRDALYDPLVLDLDGDGIELTALASSTTQFDLDGDGIAERTGWVNPQDGLLVHDANQNGAVDGVGELFGSAAVDGFDDLALIDANGDGRIDASDPAFVDLLVWRDLNGDGEATPDELLTMAQAGIARLDLAYTQVDDEVAGNILARTGTYVRSDGSTRTMGSVQFALDQTTGRPQVPEGTLLGDLYILPNLAASAGTPDLRTAMYFDPVLRAMVEELVFGDNDFETFIDFTGGGSTFTGPAETFERKFLDVLYRWLGVDTSVPAAPDRPYYYEVYEALTGLVVDPDSHSDPEALDAIWPQLVGQLGVSFLIQAAHNPRFTPLLELAEEAAALDPDASGYLDSLTSLSQAALAASQATTPAYDYLELFESLSINPDTGAIEGDFDAFVVLVLEDQPSYHWATAGGGIPPWAAWYNDQGILLFTVGQAMGYGRDYVLNVTGWRWFGDDVPELTGTSGSDLIDASGMFDQRIYGFGGNDELRGNDGVDRLIGGVGDDLLKGGSGSDMYVYAAGDGLDRIIDDSGADDTIYFSSEFDSAELLVVRIAGTNDLQIHFGSLSEGIVLTGQWGASWTAIEHFQFVGEQGLHAGDIASLYLATLATSGSDTIVGSWASERINGLDGADTLYGQDGDDVIDGGTGRDILSGDYGGDRLIGGAGNDDLYGGRDSDTLIGGEGDDWLEGYREVDTYVYSPGDGNDIIRDYWDYDGWGADTLIFGAGIAPVDLVFSRTPYWQDIRISFANQAGSIIFSGQNTDDAGIESIIFADGTIWDHAEILARYVAAQQSAGNDTIWGTNLGDTVSAGAGDDVVTADRGSDILIGGTGNDWLEGYRDADTYVYAPGDGDDVILDYWDHDSWSTDALLFGTGITPSDIVFARGNHWNDIRIQFANQVGSITLAGQNVDDAGIEAISFADGTVWNHAEILARYVTAQQSAGNDTIWGTNLGDSASGGAGNDAISTGRGSDILIGGAGDDYLEGYRDADTYAYAAGDGNDTIFDYWDYDGWGADILEFGAGIAASDLIFTRAAPGSNDVMITFANGPGSILLQAQFWSDAGIELIRFSDGSSLTSAQFEAMVLG